MDPPSIIVSEQAPLAPTHCAKTRIQEPGASFAAICRIGTARYGATAPSIAALNFDRCLYAAGQPWIRRGRATCAAVPRGH